MKTYKAISQALAWLETVTPDWQETAEDKLEKALAWIPSGSGIDSGTELDRDESTPEKLIFRFSFHHMNDAGYYDGWTEHKAIVKPSLRYGFDLKITGRNRNDIKEYLDNLFSNWLDSDSGLGV